MSEPFRYRTLTEPVMLDERLGRVHMLEKQHYRTGLEAEEIGGLTAELARDRVALEARIAVHAEVLWPSPEPGSDEHEETPVRPVADDGAWSAPGGVSEGPTPVTSSALDTASALPGALGHEVDETHGSGPGPDAPAATGPGGALAHHLLDDEPAGGRHESRDVATGPFDRVGPFAR